MPGVSVRNHLLRGATLKGICRERDCRRSCEVDMARQVKFGLADADATALARLMKCNRMDHCPLTFHEEPLPDLRLSDIDHKDHVRVKVVCRRCKKGTIHTVGAVIARLVEEKKGGGDTGIKSLASKVSGDCGKCHLKDWTVQVLWHDPAGAPAWHHTARPPWPTKAC